MTETTILDRLDRQARERRDRPAIADPRGGRYDAWNTQTWAEYAASVYRMARAFVALGHQPGEAVTISGPNLSAWVIADLAAIAAGGMPAGIYSTLTPDQVQYIVRHSCASIAVCSDMAQAQKIISGKDTLPALKAIVLFPEVKKAADAPAYVYTWEDAAAKASEVPESKLAELRAKMAPDGVATLIYTSGTTGQPKAVALSHENLVWTSGQAIHLADARPGDRVCSYLPLSHIAEQMMTIHVPITVGATAHFVPQMTDLPTALVSVRPTSVFGVPRVWEKIQAKVEAGVAAAPPVRQKLFAAARKVGYEVGSARFEGRPPPFGASLLYGLFDKLVYSKLRDRLGLDQARMLVSGAAALPPATRDWFLSLGLPLAEVYGQSEDCGPTSYNKPGEGKLGTVGRPVPGVQVKIAEDGEILVKGKNVFLGYYKDEGATKDAKTDDGWLRSGDVGELDAQGFLRITDRKKELFKTVGGKYIAPTSIEKLLCELDLVSQAVVIGEGRKFVTALVTLMPEQLDSFAKQKGITESDPAARSRHPVVRAVLEEEIRVRVNAKLARYEQVKKFEILPRELSEEHGEMTPTMKIKRKVVAQRYQENIEKLYEGSEAAVD